MNLEIKIMLTMVFAGLAVSSLLTRSEDPGSSRLWFGNKRLLGIVADGMHLKRWVKPAFVFISFGFFGAGILIIWSGE